MTSISLSFDKLLKESRKLPKSLMLVVHKYRDLIVRFKKFLM